jgi:iron(III) transport system permease protein
MAAASETLRLKTPASGMISRGLAFFRFGATWTLPAVAVVLLVVYPLLSFLALAVWPGLFGQGSGGFSLQPFAEALNGYNIEALFNSLWISLGAGVIGTATGAWLAWVTARTRLPGARLIELGIWLVLLLPSYFMAIGWQTLLAPGGLLNLPWLASIVLGPIGVMFVLGLKFMPFAYLTLVSSWKGLPEEIDEAGRVHGLGGLTRTRLALRLIAPGLAAAFAIVYAEALSDFGVAATLAAGVNFPLATYAIYSAISSQPLDFPLAAAASWMLIVLVLPAVWLQARINRHAGCYSVLTGRARPPRPRRLRPAHTLLHLGGAVIFLLLALGVPLIAAAGLSLVKDPSLGFAPGNLTLEYYARVFQASSVFGALLYSARMAVLSGLAAVVLALALTVLLLRRGGLARLLDWALLTIMALPGLILAAGYIFAYNQPWLPLYGGSLLLGMAYLTGALPAASRMLLGPVGQQHRSLHEAAQVHGLTRWRQWLRIRLPLLATPLLFAWLLTSSHIVFELPASELLYPPGSPPLAVALIAYLHGYQYATEAALQIVSVLIVGGAVLLIRWLFARLVPAAWRRETLRRSA